MSMSTPICCRSLRCPQMPHYASCSVCNSALHFMIRLCCGPLKLLPLSLLVSLQVQKHTCKLARVPQQQLKQVAHPHCPDYSLGKLFRVFVCFRYIWSLYWSITTLATVGYGDLHAYGPIEAGFILIYMLFGIILNAYILGTQPQIV